MCNSIWVFHKQVYFISLLPYYFSLNQFAYTVSFIQYALHRPKDIVKSLWFPNKINFQYFLQGYSLCNPAVDIDIENNAHVPYAFRMGLISDELFQVLMFQK